jgi:hypothetical protein
MREVGFDRLDTIADLPHFGYFFQRGFALFVANCLANRIAVGAVGVGQLDQCFSARIEFENPIDRRVLAAANQCGSEFLGVSDYLVQ